MLQHLIAYCIQIFLFPIHHSRLRLGVSHLNEHKYKYIFQDCLNPLCLSSVDIESLFAFFFPMSSFHNCICDPRWWFPVKCTNFFRQSLSGFTYWANPKFNSSQNNKILSFYISFIVKSERFNSSLLLKEFKVYWLCNTSNLHSC